MRKSIIVALAVCAVAAVPAWAQDDAEGCKDHPLFTRFPKTYLSGCEQSQFDMRAFPTGVPKGDQTTPVEIEGAVYWFQYNAVEGATTPSGLQFMRNFENATKSGGGSIEGRYPGWCKANYDPERMPRMGNGCLSNALTMKFVQGAKEIWAFLQASDNEGYFVMTIVEREAMKQDLAVNELADKLAKDGFVALYVNFDTGQATIRSDSSKTLDDAAAALNVSPALRIEVAGHTDNVGTPEANLTLSQARAQAVMAALAQRGVKAERMTARGYGQTTPVADNRTEEGRGKNRRVELVKK
jgi:outer membrane protein OmpA-like peptidoglycan-associated protein